MGGHTLRGRVNVAKWIVVAVVFCSSSYCSSGVGGSQVAVRDGGVGGGVRADLPLRVGGE